MRIKESTAEQARRVCFQLALGAVRRRAALPAPRAGGGTGCGARLCSALLGFALRGPAPCVRLCAGFSVPNKGETQRC